MTETKKRIVELESQIKVMLAYDKGEKLLVRSRSGTEWNDAPEGDPCWDWGVWEWRIKPKVIWVNEFPNENDIIAYGSAFDAVSQKEIASYGPASAVAQPYIELTDSIRDALKSSGFEFD